MRGITRLAGFSSEFIFLSQSSYILFTVNFFVTQKVRRGPVPLVIQVILFVNIAFSLSFIVSSRKFFVCSRICIPFFMFMYFLYKFLKEIC